MPQPLPPASADAHTDATLEPAHAEEKYADAHEEFNHESDAKERDDVQAILGPATLQTEAREACQCTGRHGEDALCTNCGQPQNDRALLVRADQERKARALREFEQGERLRR